MRVLAEGKIEQLFGVLDRSTELIQKAKDQSYLDSLIETLGFIQSDDDEDPGLTEADIKKLTNIYAGFNPDEYTAETIRKGIQMAILKAIRIDKIQANYQITPDTIANVIGYIVSGIFHGKKELSLLDPAMGTGNLLTTIYHQLETSIGVTPTVSGIENDDAMFELAADSVELQKIHAELFHEDTIQNVLAPVVDAVVSDLPIGYYPIDANAKGFATHSESGHSYVHHLMIEFGMKHVKPGGFGFFLVPSQLFQTSEAKQLLKWMQGKIYLQGLLNLPKELFQNSAAQKAILILQNSGEGAKQVDPVMLGEFPSFKDQQAFTKFLTEIDDWEQNDLL
ncbi:class I SAM-dependent methyltransferase [Lentilactobacillus otakiensis]|uniref:Adenine-specific DNA methylase n=1 Tax=Lentilactobacillus otakiensis DSM 19908 = JCM 15040 TaxID=1423780 RepID=S4NFB1_9LACO|nr:class I SAM-dependent methyltransferase [Lentilactobacillus otakiensis]KRL09067.1 adenine-specific DNA methylase [Lentilactobacillus otakiensis DSM 19908 = JCM 15040]MBZ3775682.1 class I SAM-dependent methyltransferase [Lentilactobacillus otakiensis]MDV3518901.1 class I SAM-dependent methyltransferase [Lentilactobacillus otakiensis]GAD15937.1 adenine-specific DNA methylase [Lentilactobacillus otakiensis DSM 19908 = JCM 15040]